MFTASEYLFEILTYNRKHGTHDSLDVTQAKVIDENPGKRDFALDQKMRFFIGANYDEIIRLYHEEGYPDFCDAVDKAFAAFETPEVTSYDAEEMHKPQDAAEE